MLHEITRKAVICNDPECAAVMEHDESHVKVCENTAAVGIRLHFKCPDCFKVLTCFLETKI